MPSSLTKPKVKMYLRAPISYYGGKQSLLTRILPLIPQHDKYIEPFLGGQSFGQKSRPKSKLSTTWTALWQIFTRS